MFAKARNNISQMQMIALGFFCIILIGTLLLMTPAASRSGTPTDFLTALFTSTMCTCVDGTGSHKYVSALVTVRADHHYHPDSDWGTGIYHFWFRFFPFSSQKNHVTPARFIKRERKCAEYRRNRPACTINLTGNFTI